MKERCCLRCGHSWKSHSLARPALCPGCKSRKWDVDTMLQRVGKLCTKCGHSWRPHNPLHRPIACPSCRSRAWDGLHDWMGRLLPGCSEVLPVRVLAPAVIPVAVTNGPKCGYCFDIPAEGCARCNPVAVPVVGPGDDCPRCHGAEHFKMANKRDKVATKYVGCGICSNISRCEWCSDNGWPGGCPACGQNPLEIPAVCFMCGGAGCPACNPLPVVTVQCTNCHDRGMVAARGGCPACGRVYTTPVVRRQSAVTADCFACGGVGRYDGIKCPICGVAPHE